MAPIETCLKFSNVNPAEIIDHFTKIFYLLIDFTGGDTKICFKFQYLASGHFDFNPRGVLSRGQFKQIVLLQLYFCVYLKTYNPMRFYILHLIKFSLDGAIFVIDFCCKYCIYSILFVY